MHRYFKILLLSLVFLSFSPAREVMLVPDGNITYAMRNVNVQGGDVVRLAEGEYTIGDATGLARYEPDVIIRGNDNVVISCLPTCYLSGPKGLRFENLTIKGRINIDDIVAPAENISFVNVRGESSAGTAGTEIFKLTRIKNSLLSNVHMIRMKGEDGKFVGAGDRLVDYVGGENAIIEHSTFELGNNGCIQAKGGIKNLVIHDSFFNYCGQRAIQIGGSTCWQPWQPNASPPYGCWGSENGSPISPDRFGWEALGADVSGNIVVANGSCYSISTAKDVSLHHNTCYMPWDTGGAYLIRFLQEVEPQTKGLIQPSQGHKIYNNAFFYAVTRADGKGGVNGEIINSTRLSTDTSLSWDERTGQFVDSIVFDRNGVYATSPITVSVWGNSTPQIYPHRHPNSVNNYWQPFSKWKTNWVDQINPYVVDWGLPTMKITSEIWNDIGAYPDHKIGADNIALAVTAPAPIRMSDYPEGTEFYGWEDPTLDVPPVEEDKIYKTIKLTEEQFNLLKDLLQQMLKEEE